MQVSSGQSLSSVSPVGLSNIIKENQLENVNEEVNEEVVLGLDVEEEQYVYLRHSSKSKVWKIVITAAIHSKLIKEAVIDNDDVDNDSYGRTELSPMVISEVESKTIELMVSYMNYYNGKSEKCSPTLPLKNIDISYILGDEYELFTEICDKNLPMKEKLIIYNDYIQSAIYFGFVYLHKKLCAIVANIFKDLTLSELQKLSSS